MESNTEPTPLSLEFCAVSLCGARSKNQDALLVANEVWAEDTEDIMLPVVTCHVSRDWKVFAIADGMGGHLAGEVASRFVLARLSAAIDSGLELTLPTLEKLILTIHAELGELGRTQGSPNMGTTLSGFLVRRSRLLIFNVGDSRTYVCRDDKLVQVTRDHSLREQTGNMHVAQNILYSTLGGGSLDCQVDVWDMSRSLEEIQGLLVTCDGFHEFMNSSRVTDLLLKKTVSDLWKGQLDEAITNGSQDNVSVIAARLVG